MLILVPHWVNVVILAKFHNPSILNPDFLERNEIVPEGWKTLARIIHEKCLKRHRVSAKML
jgi:hypothetical protein